MTFGLHKGSGLAVMCEIMATAVAGGQAAHDPAKGGVLNSMLAVIIDLAKISDPASVIAAVGATRAHVKSARAAAGVSEVLTPGEPERLSAARRANGIEVDDTSWSDIRAVGTQPRHYRGGVRAGLPRQRLIRRSLTQKRKGTGTTSCAGR